MKSARQFILENAIKHTTEDRNKTHGDPTEQLTHTADLWTVYTKGAFKFSPKHVADMMELQKISRSEHGTYNIDDYEDRCGYAAIAGEVSQPHWAIPSVFDKFNPLLNPLKVKDPDLKSACIGRSGQVLSPVSFVAGMSMEEIAGYGWLEPQVTLMENVKLEGQKSDEGQGNGTDNSIAGQPSQSGGSSMENPRP